MIRILNIDTAQENASVCISSDDKIIQFRENREQKDHAAWLHVAIEEILKEEKMLAGELNAIAVTIGPGSYTGLRVGLASAKGLCFALNIPLLAINTLEMMAYAVKDEIEELVCPMIDARRMEVFTAIYDATLREILSPHNMLIDENSFTDMLATNKILFCGTGIKKLQGVIQGEGATFSQTEANATHLAQLSYSHYMAENFANLVQLEPLYIKEFYSAPR